MNKELILTERIYPAIKSCVGNRYKIVAGIFSVYAFISSSLNQHRDIINKDLSLFAAWVFTFFAVHNLLNYCSNAWDQYKLEGETLSTWKKLWYLFRGEGLFFIAIMAIIWLGYFCVLKPILTQTCL